MTWGFLLWYKHRPLTQFPPWGVTGWLSALGFQLLDLGQLSTTRPFKRYKLGISTSPYQVFRAFHLPPSKPTESQDAPFLFPHAHGGALRICEGLLSAGPGDKSGFSPTSILTT